MTIKEMIAVMQAADEGKTIQVKKFGWGDLWDDCCDNEPEWDWKNNEYRVKPETNTRPMTFEEIKEYWKTHKDEVIHCKEECTHTEFWSIITGFEVLDQDDGSVSQYIYLGSITYLDYNVFIRKAIREDGTKFEIEKEM